MIADDLPGPSLTTGLRSPDFIGIGAPKAGTTWLSHNIRQHPGIWQPPFKEVRYFNQRHGKRSKGAYVRQTEAEAMVKRMTGKPGGTERFMAAARHMAAGDLNDDWYLGIFGFAPPRCVCGEISPTYAVVESDAIAHAARVAPMAKLILCIRDPIERAWSHLRMMAKLLHVKDPLDLLKRPAPLAYVVPFSNYAATLRSWSAYYPRDRILVISADDIDEKPLEVLQQVCLHLAVEYQDGFFSEASKQIGVGAKLEMPDVLLSVLKPALRSVYDQLEPEFPDLIAKWSSRYY